MANIGVNLWGFCGNPGWRSRMCRTIVRGCREEAKSPLMGDGRPERYLPKRLRSGHSMSPNFRVNNNAVRNLLAPWIDGKPRWSYEFFTRHFAPRHQQTIFVILSRERPDLSERAIKGLVCKREGIQARQEQSCGDPDRSSPDLFNSLQTVTMVLCL